MKHIENTHTTASAADKIRYFLASLLLIAALVAYYTLVDLPLVIRVLIIFVGVGAALGVAWSTLFGQRTRKHLQDTLREVRQVVWPTREQAVRMTMIVFAAIALVGVFLWLVDMFFLWGVQNLTGRGE
jgi:preprotein translocase subunit SecE